MWKKLLSCLAVCSTSFWLFAEAPSADHFSQLKQLLNFDQTLLSKLLSPSEPRSLRETNNLLHKAGSLQENVIQKALSTLSCADKYHVKHNHILTIIDYSIPSNQKRLWVFDLQAQKLLYYTYVSHGINSGSLETCHFSNKYNSKASSLGIYTTEKAYPGREGLSLRLDGLDSGFNDHASGRSIVMHGGWYLNEKFIQRYGRPGRSWGCPALPEEISKSVINTIKDKSLLIIYYPSEHWFAQSKFLRCENLALSHITPELNADLNQAVEDNREDIVYADLKNHRHKDDSDPVLTISTDDYEQIFHIRAPVARMLRRQINHTEHVALTPNEIEQFHWYPHYLNPLYRHIYFIVPDVKIVRGYANTQMRIINLGPIKTIKDHMIFFEKRAPIPLRATNHFIRWLGL
jgi:hypothetical protein